MYFQDIPLPVEEKPTKQEYAIATYLKKNCPTKKTKFLNHQVNYFYGNSVRQFVYKPYISYTLYDRYSTVNLSISTIDVLLSVSQ